MLGHEPRSRSGIDWKAHPHAGAGASSRTSASTSTPHSLLSSHSHRHPAARRHQPGDGARRPGPHPRRTDVQPGPRRGRPAVRRHARTCATRVSPSSSSATSSTRSTRSPNESRSSATASWSGSTSRVTSRGRHLVTKMIGREIDELDRDLVQRRTEHRPLLDAGPPGERARPARRRSSPATSTSTRERSSGMAGLLGSGRTELARLLYGADHADVGQHRGRRRARQDLLATSGDGPPDRLLVRGPPRRGDHRRPHRRREHHPGHPGAARAGCASVRRASRRPSSRSTSTALGVRPADPTSSPATSPAATSRRSSWPDGWRPLLG